MALLSQKIILFITTAVGTSHPASKESVRGLDHRTVRMKSNG
jgi:hypothetical protein